MRMLLKEVLTFKRFNFRVKPTKIKKEESWNGGNFLEKVEYNAITERD